MFPPVCRVVTVVYACPLCAHRRRLQAATRANATTSVRSAWRHAASFPTARSRNGAASTWRTPAAPSTWSATCARSRAPTTTTSSTRRPTSPSRADRSTPTSQHVTPPSTRPATAGRTPARSSSSPGYGNSRTGYGWPDACKIVKFPWLRQ